MFRIYGTDEALGDLIGFNADMPSFNENAHILIGDIELEVEDISYEILMKKQIIEATITCLSEEDARTVREEVEQSLSNAGYNIFYLGSEDDLIDNGTWG